MVSLIEAHVPSEGATDSAERVKLLERRLARERQARIQAEAIAEKGLRDLYEKQRHLELLERIATSANLSASVDEAFRFALEAIREHTDAFFGNVCRRPPDGSARLQSADICQTNQKQQPCDFLRETQSVVFEPGVGLPGRVLASGQAAWIADVTTDGNFPRLEAARAVGIRGAFAFPVLVGSEVLAVMEFFYLAVVEPDTALLSVLGQIGTQLGRVMERSRAEAKLFHDASHDTLTGLPNRRALIDRMEEARRSRVSRNLLLVDLDRFKAVNDTFGHHVGDRLLVEVAARAQAMVAGRGFLARLGGDELAVLAGDDAVEIADALVANLAEPFALGSAGEISIGCSVGFACSDAAADVTELMQQADIALYEAKRQGRGRTVRYEAGMMEAVAERHALEIDLRAAIGTEQLFLAYQPVMALAGDRIVGYEALIRWRHPVRGLVSPAIFIPVAEETGQIVGIGRWVLEEACRAAASWGDGRHVAVNVSSVQFRSPLLLSHVTAALAQSRLPAHRLEVELTETAIVENGAQIRHALEALRALGIKVAMDDFGTGYSSLAHLRDLPLDRIKIDRSFVATAETDHRSLAVLRAVMQIGRDLDVPTLAEGVETESQLALLRSVGCGAVQGYLIGRPERMSEPLEEVRLRA